MNAAHDPGIELKTIGNPYTGEIKTSAILITGEKFRTKSGIEAQKSSTKVKMQKSNPLT